MEKEKLKVALILYTQGLQYDDRIRKEIMTLSRLNDIEFEIFALVPQNEECKGITDYGVNYYIPYLKSRNYFPSGKFTFIKALEFFFKIRKKIKKHNIIWCADVETLLFAAFVKQKPIIWDLHEIPSLFCKNKLTKLTFQYLENNCSLFYHANQYRIDYLIQQGLLKKPHKHVAIRNFPNNIPYQIKMDNDQLYNAFLEWLGCNNCVYLQGLSSMDRRPIECISAVMQTKNLKALVVGSFDKNIKDELVKIYGEQLKHKIYFIGKIEQNKTCYYIDKCVFSMIFYSMNNANNYLCEPNRMFQSIFFGKPVIVGCNPPMKDIVEKYGFGIVLKHDGNNIDDICNAISSLQKNYKEYKNNIEKNKDKITWESQESLLDSTFKSVLTNFRY